MDDLNMEEMITILDLPNEMIIAILNELYLPQLIECRSICKKIKSIIDSNFRKKKLAIFHPNSFGLFKKVNHIYNYEPINFKNSFKSFKLDHILSSSFFCHFFIDLKELYLINKTYFNLDLLNNFNKLETLSLHHFASYEDKTIKLPNLKNFSIPYNVTPSEVDNAYKIKIESKIERLKYQNYFNQFEFVHPEKIKHIETYSLDLRLNLADFENLEILHIYCLYINEKGNDKEKKILINLKKLKEIHIHRYDLPENSIEYFRFFIELKNSKKLKIDKIYLFDIELIKEIEHYRIGDDLLKTQLLNYELLDYNLSNLERIDYNNLMKCLNDNEDNLFQNIEKHQSIPRLPFDFFLKFNNIKQVYLKEFKIDNEFINFLKNCKCLLYLEIENCDFEQHFLDQLPSISNYKLCRLVLHKFTNTDKANQLNFEFILKLPYIYVLEIIVELDIEFALNLIKNCKHLYLLEFYHRGMPITLKKYSTKYDRRPNECGIKTFKDHFGCYNESSIEYMNSNFHKYDQLYCVVYFNRTISRIGFNYEQLTEYVRNIGNLVKIELENGKSCEYNSTGYDWIHSDNYSYNKLFTKEKDLEDEKMMEYLMKKIQLPFFDKMKKEKK